MNNPFLGTGIAIVTPFKEDLTIDFKALENLVEYNINNGIDYIVISGTTGESVTITKQEKQDLVTAIIKYNKGRLPLVLGIGGNNTAAVVQEIKTTDLANINGILSVSPYYSKPTQEGIYQHFKTIANACPVPVILYNVPGRTSKNMSADTILRLANDFSNIVGVKEAGGDMSQYLELLKNKPENFSVISGDDDLALGVVLAGGAGVISVIAQALPSAFSTMINLGLKGQNKDAYQLQFKMMEIIHLIFSENNPAGIKAVLNTLKLCNNTVRLPLVPASNQLQNSIAEFITNFNKS